MAKKGLITSLILGAVITLSLGVYTLVSAIIALTAPIHRNEAVAYTSEQTITAFSNYSEEAGNLTLEYQGEKSDWLILDAKTNTYTVDPGFVATANVGEVYSFKAIATTDKHGSTTTYDVAVYIQGTGASAEDAFYVANAEGLVNLAAKMDEQVSVFTDAAIDSVVELVADVNLAGIDWKGFATKPNAAFTGTFNGNGHSISNMNININADNYQDHYVVLQDTYSMLTTGLFRNTLGAEILGLSLENATITMSDEVLEILTDAGNTTPLEAVRAGLLVGDARNTIIDGQYTVETTEYVTDEDESSATFGQQIEVVTETKYDSVISGTINGYAYGTSGVATINGLGGVAGVVYDYNTSGADSKIAHYTVNFTANNASNHSEMLVGGLAGQLWAQENNEIVVEECNITLSSNALYNNKNRIGGLAGRADFVKASGITTTVSVEDVSQKDFQFDAWLASDDYDADLLTYVAGIVAYTSNSSYEDITSNVAMAVYTRVSAGFVVVNDSDLTNVITAGRVIGYEVSGLAEVLRNSNATYTNTEETALVAANVNLTGYNAAGLANFVESSNIKAEGKVNVEVVSNAIGKVENTNIQNTQSSAGLVGYFYAADASASSPYEISGFEVKATFKDGFDVAGLVAYLGNDDSTSTSTLVLVKDCTVSEMTVTSRASTGTTSGTTHKVGGAVAVIYGCAELNNVDVLTINLNQNRAEGNTYGVAMFGGLVARVGGEYVVISNCDVAGDAYITGSAYTKAFNNGEEFIETQILAGGLIGAIASYGTEIPVGKHPVYGTNDNEIDPKYTRDDVQKLDTRNIAITNNSAAVDIVITFQDQEEMHVGGYRTRAAGSFIGLIMNGTDSASTVLDLSTNTVSGKVDADKQSFEFYNAEHAHMSSLGYGNVPENTETPSSIGISYDFVNDSAYTKITMPTIPAETLAA